MLAYNLLVCLAILRWQKSTHVGPVVCCFHPPLFSCLSIYLRYVSYNPSVAAAPHGTCPLPKPLPVQEHGIESSPLCPFSPCVVCSSLILHRRGKQMLRGLAPLVESESLLSLWTISLRHPSTLSFKAFFTLRTYV
jgi:hypothetical protein